MHERLKNILRRSQNTKLEIPKSEEVLFTLGTIENLINHGGEFVPFGPQLASGKGYFEQFYALHLKKNKLTQGRYLLTPTQIQILNERLSKDNSPKSSD